jgi:glycosyltransferase involved in cell wall biosynthesis
MKILHIWDQAGVACILAKYQTIQGHESKVLKMADYDKFGINSFYHEYVDEIAAQRYEEKCIEAAAVADIVHVHSRPEILLRLRKELGKSKKILLHYHGTDIRGLRDNGHRWSQSLQTSPKQLIKRILNIPTGRQRINNQAEKLADAIIVSTPDLQKLVPSALYLPNPVDIDHFRPPLDPVDSDLCNHKALTINSEVTNIRWALEYIKDHNIYYDIEVHDRTRKPLMYSSMPSFLHKYSMYVDIRNVNGMVLENFSKTALEALACGLEVLDHSLVLRRGLPQEHTPLHAVTRLFSIYS